MVACGNNAADRIKEQRLNLSAPKSAQLNTPVTIQLNNAVDSLQLAGNYKYALAADGKQLTLTLTHVGTHKLQLKGFVNGQVKEATVSIVVANNVAPQELTYEIVETLDHDALSYTQGLEFLNNETLYESHGQYKQSGLKKLTFPGLRVSEKVKLNDNTFAEGITILNDTIFQLTWREKKCLLYDLDLNTIGELPLPLSEGWGICNDGSQLFASNGSTHLYRLNTKMQIYESRKIYVGMQPLRQMNELEYVEGKIWANIYQTNRIYRIDFETGIADAYLDLSLLRLKLKSPNAEVLNGIAYLPQRDLFLVTGKYWDKSFLIKVKLPEQPNS